MEIYTPMFWLAAFVAAFGVWKWHALRVKDAAAAVQAQRTADWKRIEEWQEAEAAKTAAWREHVERQYDEARELTNANHEENRNNNHAFRDIVGAAMSNLAVLGSRLDRHEVQCAVERKEIKDELRDQSRGINEIRDRMPRK